MSTLLVLWECGDRGDHKTFGQNCIELSAVMNCSLSAPPRMVATSHVWLSSSGNVANGTKALNF